MTIKIINADVMDGLAQLADESVHCVVTSPPYFGLRDYGMPGQIGLEPTPAEFVNRLVEVFREVRRVLREDGTCWLNMGDSYNSGSSGGLGGSTLGGGQKNQEASNRHGRKTFRPGSGRADGVVDDRSQRNRDGISAPGFKPKDLLLIPERLAIALCDDGWYIRSRIIWAKPNPMPESVTDRPTKSHEHIWLMSKAPRYFYDAEAIKEENATPEGTKELRVHHAERPNNGATSGKGVGGYRFGSVSEGRNARDVWTIATSPFAEAHFATFPPELAERCIKAGCPKGGTVLDPFGGSGTTGLVADRLQRDAVLIELNPEYAAMAKRRLTNDAPLFAEVAL
jgi:DNA modification methylase